MYTNILKTCWLLLVLMNVQLNKLWRTSKWQLKFYQEFLFQGEIKLRFRRKGDNYINRFTVKSFKRKVYSKTKAVIQVFNSSFVKGIQYQPRDMITLSRLIGHNLSLLLTKNRACSLVVVFLLFVNKRQSIRSQKDSYGISRSLKHWIQQYSKSCSMSAFCTSSTAAVLFKLHYVSGYVHCDRLEH